MGLGHIDGLPNIRQKTRPNNNQQQQKNKRIYKIIDFAIPADQ